MAETQSRRRTIEINDYIFSLKEYQKAQAKMSEATKDIVERYQAEAVNLVLNDKLKEKMTDRLKEAQKNAIWEMNNEMS